MLELAASVFREKGPRRIFFDSRVVPLAEYEYPSENKTLDTPRLRRFSESFEDKNRPYAAHRTHGVPLVLSGLKLT